MLINRVPPDPLPGPAGPIGPASAKGDAGRTGAVGPAGEPMGVVKNKLKLSLRSKTMILKLKRQREKLEANASTPDVPPDVPPGGGGVKMKNPIIETPFILEKPIVDVPLGGGAPIYTPLPKQDYLSNIEHRIEKRMAMVKAKGNLKGPQHIARMNALVDAARRKPIDPTGDLDARRRKAAMDLIGKVDKSDFIRKIDQKQDERRSMVKHKHSDKMLGPRNAERIRALSAVNRKALWRENAARHYKTAAEPPGKKSRTSPRMRGEPMKSGKSGSRVAMKPGKSGGRLQFSVGDVGT